MAAQGRRTLIAQIGKYLIGGGVYFWVGYGVFALLYSGIGLSWLWAKIGGDIVGRTCEYALQRHWTFRSQTTAPGHYLRRYGGLVLINTAIDYAIVGGAHRLGISPYVGIFISASFFTVWNYVWYRWWVFRKKV